MSRLSLPCYLHTAYDQAFLCCKTLLAQHMTKDNHCPLVVMRHITCFRNAQVSYMFFHMGLVNVHGESDSRAAVIGLI